MDHLSCISFGIDNLYIIDNQSGQGSLSILEKYQKLGLHVSSQPDYSKKGEYLFQLIKANDCDFANPLDIDEFISLVDLQQMPFDELRRLTQACLSLNHQYYITLYPQVKTEAKTVQEITDYFLMKGYRLGWSPCSPEQRKHITEQHIETFKRIIMRLSLNFIHN